jgi:transposase
MGVLDSSASVEVGCPGTEIGLDSGADRSPQTSMIRTLLGTTDCGPAVLRQVNTRGRLYLIRRPPAAADKDKRMRVMQERCAGLDVHQKTVVACVLTGAAGSAAKQAKRTFTTVTSDLWKRGDWLGECAVTHVAMESSGVYGKPVGAVWEGPFDLTLAHAAHIPNVPGRKTDPKDAAWIAEWLRQGWIEKSCVPPVAVQDWRELTRYRAPVTGERRAVGHGIRQLREGAHIQLGSVARDVMGVSGQRMWDALVAGESDAARWAQLALGQWRKKKTQLEVALDGRVREQHRRLLRLQLANWRFLDRLTEELDVEIDRELGPVREVAALVETIPGSSALTAWHVVAEMGADMSQFPQCGALGQRGRSVSWEQRKRR